MKVVRVVSHGLTSAWHRRFLQDLSTRQLLVASSTTEGRGGGDIRNSEAPIEASENRIHLVRDASVISYGADADVIVTTARRSPEAVASDQVLAVFMRDDYTLEPVTGWDDVSGMRGTCSAGFTLRATGDLAPAFAAASALLSMRRPWCQLLHILWASVGGSRLGRRRTRKAAHAPRTPGWLGRFASERPLFHQGPRGSAGAARTHFQQPGPLRGARRQTGRAVDGREFQPSAISLLKVDASELAVSAALNALRACGLAGYRNGSEVSVGRHLRDLLSAPMMINNDRILQTTAGATLLSEVFEKLRLGTGSRWPLTVKRRPKPRRLRPLFDGLIPVDRHRRLVWADAPIRACRLGAGWADL